MGKLFTLEPETARFNSVRWGVGRRRVIAIDRTKEAVDAGYCPDLCRDVPPMKVGVGDLCQLLQPPLARQGCPSPLC